MSPPTDVVMRAAAPSALNEVDGQPTEVTRTEYDPANPLAQRAAVLESIFALTEPAPAPAKWAFLPPSLRIRRLRVEPAELLELLPREFAEDALVHSGVFAVSAGELRLSPIINSGANLGFIFDADKLPRDLYADQGALHHASPAFSMYAIKRGDPGLKSKNVYIVETVADELVLANLNLDAICSIGLERLNSKQVKEMFSIGTAPKEPWKYSFTLLDADLVGLSDKRVPRAGKISRHLALIEEFYGLNASTRLHLWRPTAPTMKSIRAAAALEDGERAREIIVRGRKNEATKNNTTWKSLLEPDPPTFSAVYARLDRAVANSRSRQIPLSGEAKEAMQQLQKLFGDQIVNSLLRQADACTDPTIRMTYMMLAEYSSLWYDGQPLLYAGEQLASGNYPSGFGTLAADWLSQRMKLSELILRISKHLHK